MKINYVQDTGTLYTGLRSAPIELDSQGGVCAITMEHARERADIPQLSIEQIAA